MEQRVPLEGDKVILLSRCVCLIDVMGSTCITARPTHHGNSIGGKKLLGTHGCDVGDVGKDVNEGHEGDGDEDGTRKVPGDNKKK